MNIKFLTLSTFAFALTGATLAQTDPYLFGLRAELPATEKMSHVRIATLFEVWKDTHNTLQSNGYFEMGFTAGTNPRNYVLTVQKIAQMSDQNGVLLYRGGGVLKNTSTNTSTEVYVEYYGMDRRKAGSGAGDKPDVFAIHIWRPNTDIDIASRWEFPGFHQVEIYRP